MTCLKEFTPNEIRDRVLRIFKCYAFGNQAEVIHPDYVSDYTLTVNELNKSLYFNILDPVRNFYKEYGGEWLLRIVDAIKPFLTSIHNQEKKTFNRSEYELIYKKFLSLRTKCFNFVNEV